VKPLAFVIRIEYGTDDPSNFRRGMATPAKIVAWLLNRSGVARVELVEADPAIPVELLP
jgi:hypothetical protein